jgi:hypothetical protein
MHDNHNQFYPTHQYNKLLDLPTPVISKIKNSVINSMNVNHELYLITNAPASITTSPPVARLSRLIVAVNPAVETEWPVTNTAREISREAARSI